MAFRSSFNCKLVPYREGSISSTFLFGTNDIKVNKIKEYLVSKYGWSYKGFMDTVWGGLK